MYFEKRKRRVKKKKKCNKEEVKPNRNYITIAVGLVLYY